MKKKKWYNIILIWNEKEEIICRVKSEGLAQIIVNQLKETVYKEPVYKLKIAWLLRLFVYNKNNNSAKSKNFKKEVLKWKTLFMQE